MHKGNEYLTDTPYIRVIYSINGLGDRSYIDNIHYGIWQAKVRHGEENLNMDFYSPTSMEMAENAIADWYSDRFSSRQLLIIADPLYIQLFDKHPEWKSEKGAEIFIVDSERKDLDMYNWFIPLYGISHLAGQMLKTAGVDSVAMVIANDQDYAISEASLGFINGYTKSGGNITDNDIYYLANKSFEGYYNPDSLYRLCYTLDKKGYRFVVPIAGGSAQGIYRYTRQNTALTPKGMFYTCGYDVDMQEYSNHVAFSILKRTDKLVSEFIDDWIAGKELEKTRFLGLGSDYVDFKTADRFVGTTSFPSHILDSLRAISIQCELEHYSSK